MNLDLARQRYEHALARFEEHCSTLIDGGYPYLAVILCHELYRFLYPTDPYASFEHTTPVAHTIQLVDGLIDLGRRAMGTIQPYARDLDGWHGAGDGGAGSSSLPAATSSLYTTLWQGFSTEHLTDESYSLLRRRLPRDVVERDVQDRRVLDMGCGSGRYTIALARAGAGGVVGVDLDPRSFRAAEAWCREAGLPVRFLAADVHHLPFGDASIDFVFCNGVLHHTDSISKGLHELARVLRPGGAGFVYLYGSGGVFWTGRQMFRSVMARIPLEYTRAVLSIIGMPSNRFVFCDAWYVPREDHSTRTEVEHWLAAAGLELTKLVSANQNDLDNARERYGAEGEVMWGEGDHRYLVRRR